MKKSSSFFELLLDLRSTGILWSNCILPKKIVQQKQTLLPGKSNLRRILTIANITCSSRPPLTVWNISTITLLYRDIVVPQSDDNSVFAFVRIKKLNGLVDRVMFSLVLISNTDRHRIFDSRLFDPIRNEGISSAFTEFRLVIMGLIDEKYGLLTSAPTVQRASQHLLLSMFGTTIDFVIFLRDISLAYTESTSQMTRIISVRPPRVLNMPPNTLVKVVRPLYGLPEAGIHWFVIYYDHYCKSLSMIPAVHDHWLLYTPSCFSKNHISSQEARVVTCLQTDDSLHMGNSTLIDQEQCISKKVLSNQTTVLTNGRSIEFYGRIISKADRALTLSQRQQISKLQK